MEKKLERQIDNAIYEINDVIINLTNYIEKLENDLNELLKEKDIEIENAYKEGFIRGSENFN